MFSVMAILCTVFGISTFAAAEEAPIRISDELIKQSTDAATNAERQLLQLQRLQLQLQQLMQAELKQKLWVLQQEMKQQQRLQHAQETVLAKAEDRQEEPQVNFVKAELRQKVTCKPIEFVDVLGVTHVSYTDESCDERVMHWNANTTLSDSHWDPELEARSRQIFQFDETDRLIWLQEQENRKKDQQQGSINPAISSFIFL
jgi:hypothetical protein